VKIKEISSRNDKIIQGFIEHFSMNGRPIEVSFRNLLPEIKNIDRYTHLIHSYPAKLLVHIPYFFLNNTIFSKVDDYILDPFNGSGTVLLESLLAHRNAFGADANPLARLISEVKVTKLDTKLLEVELSNIKISYRKNKDVDIPDVINCDYWFPKRTQILLAKVLTTINEIENDSIRKFMMVSFSNCVKKVSYADQRVSVPVKLNPNRYKTNSQEKNKVNNRLKYLEEIDVTEKFCEIAKENINRFKEFETVDINGCNARIIAKDARKLSDGIDSDTVLKNDSIQLVITSPPYAGAQKYIRASSLNLGWTELAKSNELLLLDKVIIGRENFRKSDLSISLTGIKPADILINKIRNINPVRASIVFNYLIEMKSALDEMTRVLKKGGYLILILGNNKVCNTEFNTQEYLTEYLISKGLILKFKLIDDIKSYGLMTKRNKTADIISREWILVFQKYE
jgi:DNA modification methylase